MKITVCGVNGGGNVDVTNVAGDKNKLFISKWKWKNRIFR